MKKKWLVWIPATVLAGFVALGTGYRLMGQRSQIPFVNTVSREEKSESNLFANYADLLNKNEIIVKNTAFNPPGFVVIKEEVYGNPTGIVGVSELVEESGNDFVIVALSKEIKRDDVFYVNYFIDNGDGRFDSNFDLQKETLLGQKSYIKLIVVASKSDDARELKL